MILVVLVQLGSGWRCCCSETRSEVERKVFLTSRSYIELPIFQFQ
jgi:hypothetical protein